MSEYLAATAERRRRERRFVTRVWVAALIINLLFAAVLALFPALRYSILNMSEDDISEEEQRQYRQALRERLEAEKERVKLDADTAEQLMANNSGDDIESIAEFIYSMLDSIESLRKMRGVIFEDVHQRTLDEFQRREFGTFEGVTLMMIRMANDAEMTPRKLSIGEERIIRIKKGFTAFKHNPGKLETVAEQFKADPGNSEKLNALEKLYLQKFDEMKVIQNYMTRETYPKFLPLLKSKRADYVDAVNKYREKALKADMTVINDTSMATEDIVLPKVSEIKKMEAGDLFRLAIKLDLHGRDVFNDFKAGNLCLLRNISFKEAKDLLPTLAPKYPELDALAQQPKTLAEMEDWKHALQQLRRMTANMSLEMMERVNSAGNMLNRGGIIPVSSSGGGIGNMYSNFSSADPNMTVALPNMDIAGIMRQEAQGSGVAVANDIKGNAKEMMLQGKPIVPVSLNESQVRRNAMPGRRFSSKSDNRGWLYVDTWYVVGPWENHGTVNYNRSMPPEEGINFDAVYKNGKLTEEGKPRELAWQFVQSSTIRVTVPDEQQNSTYYLYTELYFEEDMEMSLVVASDDAARVWVTNPKGVKRMIWHEERKSSWSMDEGAKKVFFAKGFHRVLVRLENGPTFASFSMLLCDGGITNKGDSN